MTALIQNPLTDLLRREWYDNSVQAWLIAAGTAVVVFAILVVIRSVGQSRLAKLAATTANHIDDMFVDIIGETRVWALLAFSIYFAALPLDLAQLKPHLHTAAKLLFLCQAALWGAAGVTFWVTHYMRNRTGTSDRASVAMIAAMGVGAKVLLWFLFAITALKTVFGIEITALITGLGVGGIAIALAVQNILGDVLAALAIVFDKPFDVGDAIAVDNLTGTVEHIGLKTTRIRSTNGEQVVIGNGDLLKSRLRNFKRMQERRSMFTLDVTYDTPVETLARLPNIVEEVIRAQSPVRFDRCHVASLTESAIRLEAVYFVLSPAYAVYMDVQQAVYLEVLRRFAAENVKFALPTRTVYYEGSRGAGPGSAAVTAS